MLLLGTALGALLWPLQAQPSADQHLEITGSHRLRLIYDYSAVWPRGDGYRAVMDLPIPPETGNQRIDQFSSTLHGRVETDDDDPPHRILAATLNHDADDDRDLRWRVEIIGTFQMRQLVDGPPPPSYHPADAPGPGQFLDSTESINWDTVAFQDWLASSGLRRQGGETPVDYAARLFAYLRAHGRYQYPPASAWTAAAGCRRLRTDCGGFSLIFAAACRANRIPARPLVGQWFTARETGDGSLDLAKRQAHVIAEFFDPRIGWIPEDISSTLLRVRGFADENFFGRDPGYFFAWHVDTDFHFAVPGKADEHVQWIQNPSLWFGPDAENAAASASHHWRFESLP